MALVRHILDTLESVAPSAFALPGDKIGLQIGETEANVKRALVSLDRSYGAVCRCQASHSQLLLSHHPLIWQPLETVTDASDVGVCVQELVRNRVNFIAAHTNWDCAPGGVNDALAEKLGLEDVTPFGSASPAGMPIGRKGRLRQPLSVEKFQELLDRALGTRSMAWDGRPGKIEWVAVVGGAADDEWRAASAADCHAFVTGEVKQHNAVEGSGWGINMYAAGHYATEQPGVEALAAVMRKAIPDVEWNVFEPMPGKSGRPL